MEAEGVVALALSRKSPAVSPPPARGVQVTDALSVGWPPAKLVKGAT